MERLRRVHFCPMPGATTRRALEGDATLAAALLVSNLRRLLLRQAMQRTKSPDQIHGMDAHDGAVAE